MENAMKHKKLSIKAHEEITGYIFILPFTIGFILFQIFPFISSFIISLTNLRYINKLSSVRFIGLDNFINLFKDFEFTDALGRSAYYAVLFIPSIMIFSIVMAIMINSKIYFRNTVRTAIFMPYISNMVAIAVVWALLLEVKDGPINMLLKTFGVHNPPMWLIGQNTAIPTVVLIIVWQQAGFYMITFLAGLQGIPKELNEAAIIDGAGAWQKFIYITIPMISPTTFFLLISAIISSLQNFGPIMVLTQGGPGDASTTLPMNIYKQTFSLNRMGYGTAQAVVLFFIILLITVFQWRGQKKWVNYI